MMATTNITIRMDEDLKVQLQELVSNLGMERNGRNLSRGFSSVEELMEDLNADD